MNWIQCSFLKNSLGVQLKYYFSGLKSWWMQLSTFLVKFLGCSWSAASKPQYDSTKGAGRPKTTSVRNQRLCITAWDTNRCTGKRLVSLEQLKNLDAGRHTGAWVYPEVGLEEIISLTWSEKAGRNLMHSVCPMAAVLHRPCLLWAAAARAGNGTWVCREIRALLRTPRSLWFVTHPWSKC